MPDDKVLESEPDSVVEDIKFLLEDIFEDEFHLDRPPMVGDHVGGGGVVTAVQGSVVTVEFPGGIPTGPVELPWVRTTVVVEHSSSGGTAPSIGATLEGGGRVTHVGGKQTTVEFPGGAPSGPVEIPGGTTVVIEHSSQTETLPPAPEGLSFPGDYSAVDEDGVPTALIGAAAVLPPANWTGTVCEWLLDIIDRLLNGSPNGFPTKGLKQRHEELRIDSGDLFHVQPTGTGSYEGHQLAFVRQQTGLLRRLDQWATSNCDGDGGGPPLPADLVEWLTIKVPTAPDSVAMPATPREPSLLDRPLPSHEEIMRALLIVGLAVALVGDIMLALRAPHPAVALVALGLSAVTVVALLTQLGYMAPLEA